MVYFSADYQPKCAVILFVSLLGVTRITITTTEVHNLEPFGLLHVLLSWSRKEQIKLQYLSRFYNTEHK